MSRQRRNDDVYEMFRTRACGIQYTRNLVSPGSTETEMQRLLWADENGAKNIIAGSQNTYRLEFHYKNCTTFRSC